MRKSFVCGVALVVSLVCCVFMSCVSTQVENVEDASLAFEKELFSSDRYIAQRGYGPSRDSAKNTALANISRYFYQSIKVRSEERVRITNSGTDSTIDEETFIESQTELFAVRYLDAVQDEKGEWQCVAYIDRDEAWQIYEPQIEMDAQRFRDLYSMASKETDPLKSALYLVNAKKTAVRSELAIKLNFAAILYPASGAAYWDLSEQLGSVDGAVRRAVAKCATYTVCEPDEATLRGGINSALNGDGFPVVQSGSDAQYVCRMSVKENEQVLQAGTFYTPQVEVTFTKDGVAVASYAFSVSRTGASNPSVAKQRAYNAVASELNRSLIQNLSAISEN